MKTFPFKNEIFIFISVILLLLVSYYLFLDTGSKSDKNWKLNTYTIITDSQNKNGSYNRLISERDIYLYDSYYNMLIYKEFSDIPRLENARASFKDVLENNLKKRTIDEMHDLDELDFLVGISGLIDYNFTNSERSEIIEKILVLQNKNGLYILPSNPDDFIVNLVSTELSLKILYQLNYDVGKSVSINPFGYIKKLYTLEEISNNNFKWSIYNTLMNIESYYGIDYVLNAPENTELKTNLLKEAAQIYSTVPKEKIEIFNILSINEIYKKLDISRKLHNDVENYISSIALEDGGYNLLDNRISDSKVTYSIFKLLNTIPSKYLEENKKFQLLGGLFTYKNEEGTDVLKTYMALQLMNLLNEEIPPMSVHFVNNKYNNLSSYEKVYINKSRLLTNSSEFYSSTLTFSKDEWYPLFEKNKDIFIFDLYNFVISLKKDQQDRYKPIIEDFLKLYLDREKSSWFELHFLIEISSILSVDLTVFRNYTPTEQSYVENLENSYHKYSVMMKLNLPVSQEEKNEMKRYLHELESSKGAYFKSINRRSYSMENTFYALSILKLLDER